MPVSSMPWIGTTPAVSATSLYLVKGYSQPPNSNNTNFCRKFLVGLAAMDPVTPNSPERLHFVYRMYAGAPCMVAGPFF